MFNMSYLSKCELPNSSHCWRLDELDENCINHKYTIRVHIDSVSIPFWCTVGMPGAILSFFIWLRPVMRQSSGIYLAALALTDCLFFLTRIPPHLQMAYFVSALHYPVVCESFAVVNIWIQYLAPMLTLCFTVERYIFICHPFLAVKVCTTRRAFSTMAIVVVFSFIISLPHCYLFKFQSGECAERSEFNDPSSLVHGFYVHWNYISEVVFFVLLPTVVLLLNVGVIRELKRLVKRDPMRTCHTNWAHEKCSTNEVATLKRFSYTRRSNNKQVTSESNASTSSSATTVTLLCVSFYYLAATFPVTMCQIIVFTLPVGNWCQSLAEWQAYFTFLDIRALVDCIGYSHYAAKFYIYILTGEKFRRELLHFVCPRSSRNGRNRNNNNNNNYEVSIPLHSGRHSRVQPPPAFTRDLEFRTMSNVKQPTDEEIQLATRKGDFV